MPHEHLDDYKRAHSTKQQIMGLAGKAEFPPDKANRIAAIPGGHTQGNAAADPEEVFVAAPARQVSNYGNIKGK